MSTLSGRYPVYLLIDSSQTAHGQLHEGVQNGLVSFLHALRRSSYRCYSDIAIIRMCRSSRKVMDLTELDSFTLPNFRADRKPGIDVAGSMSVLENDLKKLAANPNRTSEKALAILFLHSQHGADLNHIVATLQGLSLPFGFKMVCVECKSGALSNAPGGLQVLPLAQFIADSSSCIEEWLGKETSMASPVMRGSIVSTPVPYLPPTSIQEENLQTLIDSQPDSGTLTLMPREYKGPIVISKPIRIEGQGATIWALNGPVLTIESDHVAFKDVRVEVTGDILSASQQSVVAINGNHRKISLENVEVLGSFVGKDDEEGEWSYPHNLQLGQLASKIRHEFKLCISVPVACKIVSHISDLEVQPNHLESGFHELRLMMEQRTADILIHGKIYFITPYVKRSITINAYTVSADQVNNVLSGEVMWESPNWGKAAGASAVEGEPAPAPEPTASAPAPDPEQSLAPTLVSAPAPIPTPMEAPTLAPVPTHTSVSAPKELLIPQVSISDSSLWVAGSGIIPAIVHSTPNRTEAVPMKGLFSIPASKQPTERSTELAWNDVAAAKEPEAPVTPSPFPKNNKGPEADVSTKRHKVQPNLSSFFLNHDEK